MQDFGYPDPRHRYLPRPGAYALILDARRRLLLLRVGGELELPGGGIEPGETPEQALARELMEETGFRLVACHPLFCARQWLTRPGEGKLYYKLCTFFQAKVEGPVAAPSEPDHAILWYGPERSPPPMAEEVQGWAIALAFGLPGEGSPQGFPLPFPGVDIA